MSSDKPNLEVVPGELVDEVESVFDEADLPNYHTVLEVWREVLKPAREELTKKVTPQWANRMVQSYPGLTYGDMEMLRDSYFGKILQLADILDYEIGTEPGCLRHTTPEDDVEHNSHHYKNLLILWQQAILQWELDWETTDADAAIEIAAISEVHKMFFSATGITAYLDNVKFEFTEDDQADLATALEELREGQ